ncbi:MAG: glycoside hydrolase family protein [Magnetococcus sp. YQC-5]
MTTNSCFDPNRYGADIGDMINLARMEQQLIGEEGFRLMPYKDTEGHWTIGVGYNVDANGIPFGISKEDFFENGITKEQAMILLANGISKAIQDMAKYVPCFTGLDEIRKRVLIDMAFNMGGQRVLTFKNALLCLAQGHYQAAAKAMLDSLWARQVPGRANRLAEMMRTGKDEVLAMTTTRGKQ